MRGEQRRDHSKEPKKPMEGGPSARTGEEEEKRREEGLAGWSVGRSEREWMQSSGTHRSINQNDADRDVCCCSLCIPLRCVVFRCVCTDCVLCCFVIVFLAPPSFFHRPTVYFSTGLGCSESSAVARGRTENQGTKGNQHRREGRKTRTRRRHTTITTTHFVRALAVSTECAWWMGCGCVVCVLFVSPLLTVFFLPLNRHAEQRTDSTRSAYTHN